MTFFIGNYNVKYVGPINLVQLYKRVHDWFIDNEWVKNNEGHNFPEIYYSHAKSNPGGQEIKIWWRFTWAPQKNPFYRYMIRVSFRTFQMHEQEMIINNKKEKMYNGSHQVIITSILETDYKKQWETHPLLKHFIEVFRMRIMYQDFEKRKEELRHISYTLQNDIKAFFDSVHYEQHGRTFHPKLGVKEEHPIGP